MKVKNDELVAKENEDFLSGIEQECKEQFRLKDEQLSSKEEELRLMNEKYAMLEDRLRRIEVSDNALPQRVRIGVTHHRKQTSTDSHKQFNEQQIEDNLGMLNKITDENRALHDEIQKLTSQRGKLMDDLNEKEDQLRDLESHSQNYSHKTVRSRKIHS